MTIEEAKKFLKNVIAYPLKPDGENKYPNYWRSKFNEILRLLEEQSEALKEAERGILDARAALADEEKGMIDAYLRYEVPLDTYEYRAKMRGKSEGLDTALRIVREAKDKAK